MRPVDGKLVERYDLKALKELYGGAFDGVLITRGDGRRQAVTPQDVASAMRPGAADAPTPPRQTVPIDANCADRARRGSGPGADRPVALGTAVAGRVPHRMTSVIRGTTDARHCRAAPAVAADDWTA